MFSSSSNTKTAVNVKSIHLQRKICFEYIRTHFEDWTPGEELEVPRVHILLFLFRRSKSEDKNVSAFVVELCKSSLLLNWFENLCNRSVVCELGVFPQFSIENYERKIGNFHTDFLDYTSFSCIISNAKLCQNLHFMYYLQTTQTTYFLTSPILCHLSSTLIFKFS